MKNIELVLLRHEDEMLLNIFVARVIGEQERTTQRVLYVEPEGVGNPQIFPICQMNIDFDPQWNDFYKFHGRTVDYRTTREDAVACAAEVIREFARKYTPRRSAESVPVIVTDKLSAPTGHDANLNYRFWYTRR